MLNAPYKNNIILSPCHVCGHLPPFAFSIILIWIASIFYATICFYSHQSTNISLLSLPVISFLPNPRAVFQLFILNLFVMTHWFYPLLKFSPLLLWHCTFWIFLWFLPITLFPLWHQETHLSLLGLSFFISKMRGLNRMIFEVSFKFNILWLSESRRDNQDPLFDFDMLWCF